MKKKYTLEEFREFYKLKMRETLEQLSKDYEEQASKNEDVDGVRKAMSALAYQMTCMMALVEMENKLFEEEQ
jgi:hypothetical protein